jgi:hypothetical protein
VRPAPEFEDATVNRLTESEAPRTICVVELEQRHRDEDAEDPRGMKTISRCDLSTRPVPTKLTAAIARMIAVVNTWFQTEHASFPAR